MENLWLWLVIAGVGALHGLNPASGWMWAAAWGLRSHDKALVPLCMGDASARELTASGSLMLALAALGVHTAAMLAVTGLVARGVCRGLNAGTRWFRGVRRAPPVAPR